MNSSSLSLVCKSLKVLTLICVFSAHALASTWTTIVDPSEKADKASEAMMAKTKNVKVEDLVRLSEVLVSSKEFETLSRDSKKVKNLKIDNLMQGEDFFYMQTGPIKLVFKWIDKDNVAYKINGHPFSYDEAAHTEVWQKKILDIIQGYQASKSKSRYSNSIFSNEEEEWFRSVKSSSLNSPFVRDYGTRYASMLILPLLFQAHEAEAFQINWQSKWTWIAIGTATVALVANHYYRRHKKQHAQNKAAIMTKLDAARANLKAAQDRGEGNLSSYHGQVANFENLLTEYNSSGEVGFFGFLLGNRAKKPAMYDTIMSRPAAQSSTTPGSGGGTGVPTAPPTGSTGAF